MGAENSTNSMANSSYVNVPAMLIFGSNDSSAPLNDNVNYYNNFNASKEYLQINGADHDLGIWNGTAYGFPYNLTTTSTTEKYALSWFNYYLYANSSAINVFNGTGLTNDVSAGVIGNYALSGISESLPQTLDYAFDSVPIQVGLVLSLTMIFRALFHDFLVHNSTQALFNRLRRGRP